MLAAPAVARVCSGIDCDAMYSNALATYAFHGIGMEPNGMHTIGMDTCGFVAGAPRSVLTQQDRMLLRFGSSRDQCQARGGQPNDGEKGLFAPTCALPFAAR